MCPNRANISIKVPGMAMNQVIHVDYMCNECGNCKSFCPYASAPYKDKFTLFANEKDMADSKNDGFVVLDKENKTCKVRFVGQITDCKADDPADKLYDGLKKLICAVIDDYGYRGELVDNIEDYLDDVCKISIFHHSCAEKMVSQEFVDKWSKTMNIAVSGKFWLDCSI